MKKARYPRYPRNKRYEWLGDFGERLIQANWKMPKGKGGRPPNQRMWGLCIARKDAEILSSFYGWEADFDLCRALETLRFHPKPSIRKQAQVVIFDRISQAFRQGDSEIFRRLSDNFKFMIEAPRHPLAVAVALSHKILMGEGNKNPKPAEIVKKAVERFAEPQPQTAGELDSLNASLFRETKKLIKYFENISGSGD